MTTVNYVHNVASCLPGLIGAFVLIGWAYDVPALTQILPGLTAMNPVTAIVLILAGGALLLHPYANWKIIWAMSALIASVGCIKFLHSIGLHELAIDQFIYGEKLGAAIGVPPNQMAPNTALTLVIAGLAIATSKTSSRGLIISSQVFSCLVIALTLLAIIGYLLGIVALYGFKAFTPMAIHTACAFLSTAVAVLTVNPGVGLMRLVGDRGPAGQLFRLALPLVVVVPIVVGMLRLKGQELGYYDTGTGVALQVFGNVLATFGLLLISIVVLYRSDVARRAREFAVKRSGDQYRMAEELGQVGHWNFEVRTGQLECSAGLTRICGLPNGTGVFTRRHIMSIFHPADLPSQQKCSQHAMLTGVGWDKNFRIILPDGEIRTIRSYGKAEKNDNGKVVSLFGVYVEISELERSRKKAEVAAAAKADFLASMSHEIRTPLNSIIGFTDLLLEDCSLSISHRRQLDFVKNSGDALLTVVNDILDFSKIEAGAISLTLRAFNLPSLVQSSVSIIRQSAEAKGLTVTVDLDSGVKRAFLGDDSRLRQVLLNLLSNAVKFTQAGGILLTVASDPGAQGQDVLTFIITDTGIGVPEDCQHRLFKRFSQANSSISREYGGTGLGLAISKKLVNLMGGEIGFRSIDSGGSEFWFTVQVEPTADAEGPRMRPTGIPAQAKCILLVEDVVANQELACAMLSRSGHQVVIASNGREAIAAVQEQDFDLVLMDIQMPVMDGITATRLIRLLPGRARHVPIIALTANIMPEQIEMFRRAGMNDHVGKPIKFIELSEAITRNDFQASTDQAELAPGEPIEPVDFDEEIFHGLASLIAPERLEVHFCSLQVAMDSLENFSGSTKDLKAAAHSMVSQAGMFGFTAVSSLCCKLENVLDNDGSSDDLMTQVQAAIVEAREKIHKLQGQRKN